MMMNEPQGHNGTGNAACRMKTRRGDFVSLRLCGPVRRVALFVIVLGLLAVSAAAEAADAPARRVIARDFHLTLLDGTPVRFDDLRGKVTVIDFWGTWCKPCLSEIPDYNAFYRDYRDKDILFIAIACESGKEENVRAAAKKLGIGYPVAAPRGKDLKAFGKVRVYPTTLVIGPDGEIQQEFLGVVPKKPDMIRSLVDRLLPPASQASAAPPAQP